MGIALDIWREKRRREREVMVAEAVAEATAESNTKLAQAVAENEALKRRIAEIERSNGNTS